jgi:hypothetical protein
MKTEQMLTYAGLGLGAYLLLAPKKATTTTVLAPSVPGGTTPYASQPVVNTTPVYQQQAVTQIPPANGQPIISADSGMTQAQYDAAKALRPDAIGNPGYLLTDAEVNTYLSNYLDLRQGLPNWIHNKDKEKTGGGAINNIQDAARTHWRTDGSFEKRSFIPFNPPANKPYAVPPSNPKSSGGGSWVTTALQVAGTVVAMLGVNDDPGLNDYEVELLLTGSAIVSDILPLFPGDLPVKIKDRMETLVTYYS